MMYIRLFITTWTWLSSLTILWLLIGLARANPTSVSSTPRKTDGGIQIHIIHTNDMHARFEQTSQLSGICSDSEAASNRCYGGFARIATLVRNARAGSTPTLFLDAGDTYQGTVWFTVYQWRIVAKFLSILQPDAISLGNHEFDDGIDGLIPFLNNVTFPVLAANLNLTNEPELEATHLSKSVVLNVNGWQVGIIGYLTPKTKYMALTRNVIFDDEVEAVSEEAKRLKKSGVKILIALGHSGFTADQRIAAEVEDIDLVIGGHTNTFLYNGTQPDSETPMELYPTAITQSSGRTVYVVQAYAYTKYLGNLSVTFDSEGELTHIEGNPILVDSSIEQASDVLEELEKWRDGISNLTNTIVGSTRVLLDGVDKTCRSEECNLGNLIADAFVDYNLRQYTGTNGWTDAAIAVINGGNIRTSISTRNDNKISMADVLAVLPFGNNAISVSMTGKTLLSMLEQSVYDWTGSLTADLRGAFLQYSGIQVTYNLSQPTYSKIVSVRVRCANCSVPVFTDLNETATYSVIMDEFIYKGGDQYHMLSGLPHKTLGISSADVVIDYLKKHSPVYPAVEWRITYTDVDDTMATSLADISPRIINHVDDTDDTNSGASYITYSLTTIILPFVFLFINDFR